jgi:hypothetical protein
MQKHLNDKKIGCRIFSNLEFEQQVVNIFTNILQTHIENQMISNLQRLSSVYDWLLKTHN